MSRTTKAITLGTFRLFYQRAGRLEAVAMRRLHERCCTELHTYCQWELLLDAARGAQS